MFRLSCDENGTPVKVSSEQEIYAVCSENLHPGQFVAVIYDADWFIGCIIERSDEHKDILVKFMSKTKTNMLSWPRRDDICWVPFNNVLFCLPAPTLCGSSGLQYKYADTDIVKCTTAWQSRSHKD
jgi:hypothetical protein